jgi:outer membrane cobalamin receptor
MFKFLFFLIILTNYVSAQDLQQVSGFLLDGKTKEGIYGAKVVSKNGEKTLSETDGSFRLSIPSFPTLLVFSKDGYRSDSLTVRNSGEISMKLFPNLLEIKTVVVTAGRRDQRIEDVAISMDVLKPELINNKGFTNLEQVVDQSPGVYAMDGQVSIRGGGGFAYGAGSRVMLLWNGVPMLTPDVGDVKWNAVPMEQTSQVEIIKGASSVLYGSGALNGIIALNEKEPSSKGDFKAKIQSGMYDNPRRSTLRWWDKNPTFHLADIYYGKIINNFGFTFGVNAYLDSGYRQGENEKRIRLNGSFYYKPIGNAAKLKTGFSYNLQYQDIGAFIIWKNDSMCYQPLENSIWRQKAIRVNIDPYIKFQDKNNNKHHLKTRYYLVTTGNDSEIANTSFAQMFFADYQMQRKIKKASNLIFGLTNTLNLITSSAFGNHKSENAASYLQFETKQKKLDLSSGVRFEFCQLDTLDFDSRFKISDQVSIPVYPIFRMGAHYELFKATHLRMSIGQGVRFPSVAERFVSTSTGGLIIFKNPNLKPETGWTAEIGAKQVVRIGETWKGFFDVAGFINQYSNMTEFTFNTYNPLTGDKLTWLGAGVCSPEDSATWNDLIAQGFTVNNVVGFRADNAEKARITGLEVSFNSAGKINEVEIITLLGYTYMNPLSLNKDSTYRQTFSDTSSNMLKYRFKHLAKIDVQLNYKKISFGLSSRYNSNMDNIDAIFEGIIPTQDGPQEILPGLVNYRSKYNNGALIFDTRISYNITNEIKINLIANNFLNQEYASRPGDIQAPRNFMVQMQFAL